MKVKYLFFSMLAAAFLSSAIATDNVVEVGGKAPRIETIDGTNVGYDANSEGKIKLISFWNPKNPSSRIANRELSLKYGGNAENVEFISISTDPDEALMREVIKIDGTQAHRVYSSKEISARVFKDYDVEKSSRAFLISSEGTIMNIF